MGYQLFRIVSLGLVFFWGAIAVAEPTEAEKCEAKKNKLAGKYAFCREKAEAKAIKTGSPADFSRCDVSFADNWAKAESGSGGTCTTTGDQLVIQSFIANTMSQVAQALNAGTIAACTGSAGALVATGQTTSYGPGSDGDIQAGRVRSYIDNGDGTITDNVTGLMWEKKSYDGSIHSWNRAFTWGFENPPYTMNGTMVTNFLATLNSGEGFAGYTDWRIPNLVEMESLRSLNGSYILVDPAFDTGCVPGCSITACSCTGSLYWSSTTSDFPDPGFAWYVNFIYGNVLSNSFKSGEYYVRAVRGGL